MAETLIEKLEDSEVRDSVDYEFEFEKFLDGYKLDIGPGSGRLPQVDADGNRIWPSLVKLHDSNPVMAVFMGLDKDLRLRISKGVFMPGKGYSGFRKVLDEVRGPQSLIEYFTPFFKGAGAATPFVAGIYNGLKKYERMLKMRQLDGPY